MTKTRGNTNKQTRSLDQDAFVQDVVEGRLSSAELAAKHGRTEARINNILAGRTCKHLLERIARELADRRQRTVRQLTALQPDAVKVLERAVRGQADSASLSAAREILSRSMDAAQPAVPKPERRRAAAATFTPTRLGRHTKRKTLAELDGPKPEN